MQKPMTESVLFADRVHFIIADKEERNCEKVVIEQSLVGHAPPSFCTDMVNQMDL
jgi:hypothetical protein